jgi:hypothetical protein
MNAEDFFMSVAISKDELVLDKETAIGSINDYLEAGNLSGEFDKFQYCVRNGRQVLLGHHDNSPILESIKIATSHTESVNYIFMSRGKKHLNAYTWNEVRDLLLNGWIIGTERYPGVKIWFASTGRNSRRDMKHIFVIM